MTPSMAWLALLIIGRVPLRPVAHTEADGLFGTLFMLGYFVVAVLMLALALRVRKLPHYQLDERDGHESDEAR